MVLPEQPVTLTAEQIAALHSELRKMRHDINNHLQKVNSAVELIRYKPEQTEEKIKTALEQTSAITLTMRKFSAEFENTYGIKLDSRGDAP